ncbi:MAG TPA: SCO family protein [Anaeromyxobacter sp.]|nr:SCO family protein [Anaeromyxobacter sp.]
MIAARAALAALAALALVAAVPAHASDMAPDVEAKAREYFTDTVLVTQAGKPVRFFTDVLRDKVVVIDFIFTRCVGACPILTERMNAVRRQLGDLFPEKVRFVSISIDPEFDTPQELVHFAKKHRAEHPEWLFLTGKKADVKAVVSRLGQWTEDPGEHSTLFIAGNAKARHWTKIRLDAPAEAFAMQVRTLVGGDALPLVAAPAAR